ERHDPERGIPYFRRVVELLPDSSIGYSALGGCLFYSGETAEARSNLERAVEIGSRYDAFANLATLEFYEGRYAEAATLYEQALAMDGSDYQTWSYLGEALRFSGADPEQTRAAYTEAATRVQPLLDANPDDQALLIEMASYSALLDDPDGARSLIARALSQEVDDPNLMFSLATIYEELGDRDEALRWIDRCVEGGFPPEVIRNYPGFANLASDPRFLLLDETVRNPQPTDHKYNTTEGSTT
ncbi:MAG: tetratricopeptide repeat protein, partial [Thermoanaerobaculales bacterium]|nr:tetratricopeptide repeat protein [Thermoanaerobaculales bacterium]